MANPHVTESETQRALEALNPNKGADPNGHFPKALKTLSPYIAPTLSRTLTSPCKPPSSPMTGATPLLPLLQKHPAQQTQTYSGPSVWRLLFAKRLKLFSKRGCLPICPNFHYWCRDNMVSSPDAQPWPTSSWQKNWLQNGSTKGVWSTWPI